MIKLSFRHHTMCKGYRIRAGTVPESAPGNTPPPKPTWRHLLRPAKRSDFRPARTTPKMSNELWDYGGVGEEDDELNASDGGDGSVGEACGDAGGEDVASEQAGEDVPTASENAPTESIDPESDFLSVNNNAGDGEAADGGDGGSRGRGRDGRGRGRGIGRVDGGDAVDRGRRRASRGGSIVGESR
jgi:hypothetical protein